MTIGAGSAGAGGIGRRLLLWAGAAALCAPGIAAAAPAARAGPSVPPEPAVSEELVFQDIPVVITASRHRQKASDAPASVEVITAEDIERYGYRTLAEALASVPGMFVSYDRNYTYIGVRGFSPLRDYNRRIQTQINGHPLNDNIWDYTGAGEDLGVDMAMVDRIEVVYGPGSALYGSNALFATINVITRDPAGLTGSELALEGGSFGRGQGRVTAGGRAGGWNIAGSASGLKVAGDDLFFPEYKALGQNGGIAENTDTESSYRGYARAERGRVSMQASTAYRTKGIPTGAYFTVFDDDASRTTDERSFFDVDYRRALGPRLNMRLRGSYDEYRYWGTYRLDYGGGLLVNNLDRSTGRWVSQETQFDYEPSARQHVTFGQGLVRNFEARMKNYDDQPYVLYTDESRSYNEYSMFVQHQITPARGWEITTGVRYDDYSSFGAAFSPRFALVVGPWERWRLKVLTGRAFRAPNINEIRYEPPGNPLDSEVVASHELVLESALGPRLDLRGSIYTARVRDLITSSGAYFINFDRASTRGADLALRARFGGGVSGYLSYSYMEAKDRNGDRLQNYPPQAWKAGVSVPFGKDRWRLSTNLQYYQDRLTLLGNESGDVFLANATLLAPLFHRGARLSASVFNLFDRRYSLPASDAQQDLELIPQDGRTFALRAIWKF